MRGADSRCRGRARRFGVRRPRIPTDPNPVRAPCATGARGPVRFRTSTRCAAQRTALGRLGELHHRVAHELHVDVGPLDVEPVFDKCRIVFDTNPIERPSAVGVGAWCDRDELPVLQHPQRQPGDVHQGQSAEPLRLDDETIEHDSHSLFRLGILGVLVARYMKPLAAQECTPEAGPLGSERGDRGSTPGGATVRVDRERSSEPARTRAARVPPLRPPSVLRLGSVALRPRAVVRVDQKCSSRGVHRLRTVAHGSSSRFPCVWQRAAAHPGTH